MADGTEFDVAAAGWPEAADPAAADRLVERFSALGAAEAALAAQPAVAAMLRAIGGNSSFLADLAVRESATVARYAAEGPAPVVDAAMAELAAVPPASARRQVAAALRQARRRIALAVALADIGGVWQLAEVTGALSRFAEAALGLATAHLLRAGHDAGALVLPDPSDPPRGAGFVVLGMGKLGGHELNYSSDVDLVLLYDPAAGVYAADPDTMATCFSRYARDLSALMERRDSDGYVFRVDLRLRPDPGATPPAVSLPAALTYYESLGQNWERAAMLKARPVAGDRAMGWAFLDAIRPFIWRRGLDFAAVADLHAMKQRIDQAKDTALAPGETPAARVAGHDVKLGEGGIREIEFLAQTLLLVWAGRDPSLRDITTLGAVRKLAAAGHLPARAARDLAAAYDFLRRVEHRLQMVADRQTHSLPTRPDALRRIALFMGYPDAEAFAAELLAHLVRVRADYDSVFELVPEALLPGPAAGCDFRPDQPVPEATLAALAAMGYGDPAHVAGSVRGWLAGHPRALRSERARGLLTKLLPSLLTVLAGQPQPDVAFARFDNFLARLPAGVSILSLFQRNPGLLARVATVLGASPSLADHLALHPAALDGLLTADEGAGDAGAGDGGAGNGGAGRAERLAARLREARSLEELLGILRRVVREEDFALSVATMEGRLGAVAAAEARSLLLDDVLAALVPAVLEDFAARNGRVPGGAIGVVLLGKAGVRRQLAGSDLDLMLVYDHPAAVTESVGRRILPAPQWFVRAAHAIVGALTSRGADGPLYEVDMRLRPSGDSGPVAVSLAAFVRYHAENAWTWERMALVRARIAYAPPEFSGRLAAAIEAALHHVADPAAIRADAAAMRARIERAFPGRSPWDLKYRPGGMIDIEFMQQVGALTGTPPPAWLGAAWELYFSVQGLLRILLGRVVPDELPEASAAALLHALRAQPQGCLSGDDPVDVAGLLATLDATAAQVRAAFRQQIGEIGP
jgi:glutamate-ammonia-ligase adenylyltransferase